MGERTKVRDGMGRKERSQEVKGMKGMGQKRRRGKKGKLWSG